MKNSKDFFDRIAGDEAFAQEIGKKVKTKIDAGETDYKKIWIPIAEEYGYEISPDELDEMIEDAKAELSDEELTRVAGGTTPLVPSIIGTVIGSIWISVEATIEYSD